jgi:putative copper export protein
MPVDTLPDALLAASRLLWYIGIVLVIGASAFRLFATPSAGVDRHATSTAFAAGLTGAGFLIGGLCARVYAQTYAYFGVDEPLTTVLLIEVATALPPWSTGWLQQAGAALASALALAAAGWGLRAAWPVAHAAAVAVGVTAPMTGHAVAQQGSYLLPIALQAGHVIAAGVWLGGLAVVLLFVRRLPRHEPASLQTTQRLVETFSPLALAGAAVLVCTGTWTTWLYIPSLSDLWTRSYGLVLLLKVAMVAAVVLTGFVNWRYVRPQLRANHAAPLLLSRTAAIELTCALVVLAITAVLVGLPQPGE